MTIFVTTDTFWRNTQLKKSFEDLKIPKGYSEAVNRRRTNKEMIKDKEIVTASQNWDNGIMNMTIFVTYDTFWRNTQLKKIFEDAKGVIKSRKSKKERQTNEKRINDERMLWKSKRAQLY